MRLGRIDKPSKLSWGAGNIKQDRRVTGQRAQPLAHADDARHGVARTAVGSGADPREPAPDRHRAS
jgi:hypothetical protein